MTFSFPAGFWLLLGIPVIVLLHLFRQERRRELVSSLYLWKDIADQSSRRMHPRLLRNIHLLLQVLAVALASLALAGPTLVQRGLAGVEQLIIAVDTSASMQAGGADAPLFQTVKAEAVAVAENARGARITVVDAGPRPAVAVGPTDDRQAITEAIETLEPSGGALDVDALAGLIAGLRQNEQTRVVFLTDEQGAGTASASLPGGSSIRTAALPTGDMSNQAITAFELRTVPDGSAIEALVRVANFSEAAVAVRLRILVDNESLGTSELELEPSSERTLSLTLPRSDGSVFRAELLDHEDALTIDNTAFAAAAGERPVRVQLATPGNLFLESFLSVLPNVELTRTSSVESPTEYDVVIIDRVPSPARLTGNVITIGTNLSDGPFEAGPVVEVERAVSAASHPITDGTQLEQIQVRRAVSGSLVSRATVLLFAGDQPLLFAYRGENLTNVGFLFRLNESDLPLRGSFPILMQNIISWMAPTGTPGGVGYASPGEIVPLYVSPGDQIVVTTPDERTLRFTPRRSPFEFAETRATGIYRVVGQSFQSRFAVTLADSNESNLLGTDETTEEAAQPVGEIEPEQGAGDEIWHWLALAALVLLAADWAIWARRT